MAPQIVQTAAKTASTQAQNIAQKIAQENLEIIKRAREQVGVSTASAERPSSPQDEDFSFDEPEDMDPNKDLREKSEQQSKEILARLEAEIGQIRAQRQQMEAQRREEAQSAVVASQTKTPESGGYGTQEQTPKKGVRGAISAFARKVTSMTSKAEKQRNVSG